MRVPTKQYQPTGEIMNIIAKLATAATAALLISAGTILPATAAPATATAAPTTWDCDTLGVKQCAGSLKGIGDAWESFDAKDIRYSDSNPLRYVKTYTNVYPLVGPRSIVVRSVNIPHTWHVFTYKK
jgi:hypothetical protein